MRPLRCLDKRKNYTIVSLTTGTLPEERLPPFHEGSDASGVERERNKRPSVTVLQCAHGMSCCISSPNFQSPSRRDYTMAAGSKVKNTDRIIGHSNESSTVYNECR